ncbi:MAG: DUF2934 domain-containing protein [Acidobacteriota bacterium]
MTSTAKTSLSEHRESVRPSNGLLTNGPQPADRNEIATKAYYLWEDRGRPHGSPEADWFRAQTELAPLSESIERLT